MAPAPRPFVQPQPVAELYKVAIEADDRTFLFPAGKYIPQIFAELFGDVFGLAAEDAAILADPEHQFYWDVWDEVCSERSATDSQGRTWWLHQSGDLWAATGELPEHLIDY